VENNGGDKGEREDNLGDYARWKQRYASENEDPRELFRQVNHIAVCISYDLIDKLRWLEKETMKLSDREVEERIPHITSFLDSLKQAYVQFSDLDF
jgi:hypothetical protein